VSAEHVLRSSDTQNDAERKLQRRLEGLSRAVGEMEPGQREFCLAAIDEWLDYMAGLRDQRDALQASLEETADFLETTAATAARRDEPEMARILSNVSYKTRQALAELEEK